MTETGVLPTPAFDPEPGARSDLKAGTLYAVTGEAGWIYYGQVTPEKNVGFLRRRGTDLELEAGVVAVPVMSVVTVSHPSIGRALRSGRWRKLCRLAVAPTLRGPRPTVQWSVGTLDVTGSQAGTPEYETRVEDSAIQNMEQATVWDAEYHIPARLTADFGVEPAAWHIGGPIGRARRVKEERARRFPDAPWFELPADWVPTS